MVYNPRQIINAKTVGSRGSITAVGGTLRLGNYRGEVCSTLEHSATDGSSKASDILVNCVGNQMGTLRLSNQPSYRRSRQDP